MKTSLLGASRASQRGFRTVPGGSGRFGTVPEMHVGLLFIIFLEYIARSSSGFSSRHFLPNRI